MKNILITGAGGYIGATLIKDLSLNFSIFQPMDDIYSLEDTFRIYAFDNFMYNQGPLVHKVFNRSNIFLYKEDVLYWSDNLKRAIEYADYIIPLAAIVGAPACDKEPELSEKINYEWYEKLLNYINNNTLVIFPNTNSGYGTTGTEPCTEETPLNPISLYGKQKQKAESFLMSHLDNIVCLRLATVFGDTYRPRMDLLVNSLVYDILNKHVIEVFNPMARRNYIHVHDISYAIQLVMDTGKQQKDIYNIGNDGINCTKLNLVEQLIKILKREDDVQIKISEKEDPDKRDYIVSSNKFLQKYGDFAFNDLSTVKEMVSLCHTLHENMSPELLKQIKNY